MSATKNVVGTVLVILPILFHAMSAVRDHMMNARQCATIVIVAPVPNVLVNI